MTTRKQRTYSDEDIERYLAYERECGREDRSSYKMIRQLRSERDFHFQNEVNADQRVIELEIKLTDNHIDLD